MRRMFSGPLAHSLVPLGIDRGRVLSGLFRVRFVVLNAARGKLNRIVIIRKLFDQVHDVVTVDAIHTKREAVCLSGHGQ